MTVLFQASGRFRGTYCLIYRAIELVRVDEAVIQENIGYTRQFERPWPTTAMKCRNMGEDCPKPMGVKFSKNVHFFPGHTSDRYESNVDC
jgi:hypothetical protein